MKNPPQIVMVKTKDIHGNKDNPRTISEANLEKLVKSLKEFPEGLEKNPSVCYHEGEKIIALDGNKRGEAFERAGITEVPVIFCDDWDEKKRKRYIIAANTSFGEWDFEALNIDFSVDELEGFGVDVPELLENDIEDFSEKNKEIDIDEMENELDCECPKCGFKFKK